MSNRRCCARCKTPYSCGNPFCTCHPPTPEVEEARTRIRAEAAKLQARFAMDEQRGNRDPDHGL